MSLEQDIELIKQRNTRVETDKAWEISTTRRIFIAIVTYLAAAVWLLTIRDTMPWLKSLIPAAAYIFSTLSLPFLKRWWTNNRLK